MLINFLWPRTASNPGLNSLPGVSLPGGLGSIPVVEATLAVVIIAGAIYYLAVQRTRPARLATEVVQPSAPG